MKKVFCILMFVLAMVPTIAFADSTVTSIVIRDCDKRADTSIPFTSGCTLNSTTLPAHWTVDFILSKTAAAHFQVDGQPVPPKEFDIPAYCPIGHDTPLVLPPGPHTITLVINTGTAINYPFTLATTMATTQPNNPVTGVFGSNGEGMLAASGDPALHPELLAECKADKFVYFRLWDTLGFTTPFPSNYFDISKRWSAAGVKVLMVINFQNNGKAPAPSDTNFLLKINRLPNAKDCGVWAICLGNEIDTSVYYSGTPQQYVHLASIAYPILKQKGYVVICGSVLLSLDYIKNLVKLGVLPYCDYIDRHMYHLTPSDLLSDADQWNTYCASVHKLGLGSESGIKGNKNNLTQWANYTLTGYQGLQKKSGIYLQFPLMWLPGSTDPLCQMAPLGKDSKTPNEPFATTWKAISSN